MGLHVEADRQPAATQSAATDGAEDRERDQEEDVTAAHRAQV